MAEQTHSTRNGLICAVVFAACYWLAWPVAEMGFNDDWSFIKTAQVFAQTGHFVYNGWSAVALGWQIPWSTLFIRLFGFSFTVVKLSTLPIAMATLVLFHAILVRFNCTARNAVLGTLTLGLSPLFLPLAASCMTDVPGLLVILISLYCCKRALASRKSATTIAWLCLAAVSSVAGGTVRQIAWLGALVMVPSSAWLLRERRGVLLSATLFWVGSVSAVLYFMHWFASQPYSTPEVLFSAMALRSTDPIKPVLLLIGEILCLLLMVFPVLIAWLPQIRRVSIPNRALIAYILLVWTLYQWFMKWTLPWIGNMILWEFETSRVSFTRWTRQDFILSVPACLVISMLVVAAALALIATVRAELPVRVDESASVCWREIQWLFAPFALSYLVLLLPHALQTTVIDRYALGLMPFAILCLILSHQQWIAPKLPAISTFLLAVYAICSIAGTHDWFARQRAQLTAIDEVRASGVPRNEIQGGFEYDGWTQVENGGHVNNPRIQVPPGSYNPTPELVRVADDCSVDYAPLMPAIRPRYSIVFGPKACLVPTKYPPVQFLAWLPPFHRTIYVQEIPIVGH